MATMVCGGVVVNAFGHCQAEVRIEAERVVAIGESLAQPGDTILDASGCFVIPGGVDPHTHIEMPAGDLGRNADDWFSGTAAAVAGGTTCVIDMITPEPGGTLGAALADWHHRAQRHAVCDFSFHVGVIEVRDEVLLEMGAIARAGIPSFKIYLGYKGRLMIDDAAAFRVMREAGRHGAWTLVHAENGELVELLVQEARSAGRLHAGVHGSTRPTAGEGEATHRAIQLARAAGAPVYIVHVSCREALEAIVRARQAGQAVRGEACTHHLVLSDREYDRPGMAAAPYVLSPPLRGDEDLKALWGGLASGMLDLTATDHCPWNLEGQKDRGARDFSLIPNGGPGIEERMALVWTHAVATGRWSPEEFVARTATNAARIFGLEGKGSLQPGCDADIVVWDPGVRRRLSAATHHSRVDHSLYEGIEVTGLARYVLVRGQVAALEGKPVAEPGAGRLVRRRAISF